MHSTVTPGIGVVHARLITPLPKSFHKGIRYRVDHNS